MHLIARSRVAIRRISRCISRVDLEVVGLALLGLDLDRPTAAAEDGVSLHLGHT